MIGDGVPFHSSSKHFSFLFSIFPLGLLDWNVPHVRWQQNRLLWTIGFDNPPTDIYLLLLLEMRAEIW